jgi:hypothetical protein
MPHFTPFAYSTGPFLGDRQLSTGGDVDRYFWPASGQNWLETRALRRPRRKSEFANRRSMFSSREGRRGWWRLRPS